MLSAKFCAAIATLLVIVTVDIGEARVLQPARMLDDPADSMFDLRSSDEKLIESTLENLDTNQLLALLFSEMDEFPGSIPDGEDEEDEKEAPEGFFEPAAAAAHQLSSQQDNEQPQPNMMKRAPESELLKILGTLRHKYYLSQLNNRMINSFVSQYARRK